MYPSIKFFSILSDYNNWQSWSPWLIMEPEATVTVQEGGKSYSWDGDRIGSGNMSITNEETNKKVGYGSNFF